MHILESAVVMWTERINIALSRHPESAFNDGKQPGPFACLDFWASKATDLREILQQLEGPQITKVLKVLEIIRSPYFAAFKSLIGQLQVAEAEAKDNVNYLSSLKPHLDALSSSDFETETQGLFKPVMHVLLLIWKTSRFYNTPPALAIMMRMLCNDVIDKARDFMGGTAELFGLEPKEAVEKIDKVLEICRQLKHDYYTYYTLSRTDGTGNQWVVDRYVGPPSPRSRRCQTPRHVKGTQPG